MKNLINFINLLFKKTKENELMLMSQALTYKLLIALFPFIIFIMTLMGFFNIGLGEYIKSLNDTLPKPIQGILNVFLLEVIQTKRISLLSTSFILSIYSASTGFNSIIQGLNRAYEETDKRHFIKKRLSSIMLVFISAVLVNFSLSLFIFSDYIKNIIIKYTSLDFIPYFLDSLSLYILLTIVLLIMVIVIYKIAVCKKICILSILPGALFTVTFWLILSKGFNIYINNFSRYSKIYGSIGSLFVLVIWINMISLLLLIGGQINAILESRVYVDIPIEK